MLVTEVSVMLVMQNGHPVQHEKTCSFSCLFTLMEALFTMLYVSCEECKERVVERILTDIITETKDVREQVNRIKMWLVSLDLGKCDGTPKGALYGTMFSASSGSLRSYSLPLS